MSFRQIGTAYATSLLNVVSGLFSNLVLLRLVVSEVEKAEFGLYILVFQSAAFLGFAQLGLDLAAMRQIAEHLGSGNERQAAAVYRALLRFNCAIAIAIATISVASIAVCWACCVDLLLPSLISLVGITQAIQFATRPASGALMGAHCQSSVNLVGVLRSVATTLIALALLRYGAGVLAIPFGEVSASAAAWAILNRLRALWCAWTTGQTEPAPLGPLLKFGTLAGLGGLGWTFESASDIYVIQLLSIDGTTEVADFSLWARMPHLAFLLTCQFVFTAFPTMAARQSQDANERQRFFYRITWMTAGFAGMVVVGLTAWLPSFIHHWLAGRADRPDGALTALTAAAMVAARLFTTLFGMYWLATGRAGFSSALNWGQSALKITGSIILFHDYGFAGLFGSSALACLFSLAIYILVFHRTGLGNATSVFPITLSIGIGLVAGMILQPSVVCASFIWLAVGIGTTAIAWSASWLMVLVVTGAIRFRDVRPAS